MKKIVSRIILVAVVTVMACDYTAMEPRDEDWPTSNLSVQLSALTAEPVFGFGANGRFPEGIAVSRTGTIVLGVQPTGEIVRVTQSGNAELIADLDTGAGFMLGLAFDTGDNLYVALPTFVAATHGVWRIGTDGTSERVGPMPLGALPNAIALDPQGNVYVSDTFLGAVWRLSRDGSFTKWLQSPLLAGNGSVLGVPAGANGIAYYRSALYVANFDLGTIVRIPISADEQPGTPVVVVQAPELISADDIQFDVHGNMYVAANRHNSLARVGPAGDVQVIVEGLDFPASLAFGRTQSQRQSLFITNFGFSTGQHLVVVDVGIPGVPLQ